MLPPFIIEQIRRREQEEQAEKEAQRPMLELPLPFPAHQRPADSAPDDEADRGVVVIDLMG